MSKHKAVRRDQLREQCPVCWESTVFTSVPGSDGERESVTCEHCNTPLTLSMPLVKMTDTGYVLTLAPGARRVLQAFFGLDKASDEEHFTELEVQPLLDSMESALTDLQQQLSSSEPDWDDMQIVLSGIESEAEDAKDKCRDMDKLNDKREGWRTLLFTVLDGSAE